MTGTKSGRALSASQIAQSVAKFDNWSTHQACTAACLADLPQHMKEDVQRVFDVKGVIPFAYIDKKSEVYARVLPHLRKFLKSAWTKRPELFSKSAEPCDKMLGHLYSILTAWKQLATLQGSSQRQTEADYAGQVYNFIRTPAVSLSRVRLQCPIALPEPLSQAPESISPRSLIPDAAVFVRSSQLAELSGHKESAFKTLKKADAGPLGRSGSKIRDQMSPAATLPDKERFEFVGSIWEDKKPDQTLIDNAWRQNRMATAAIARQNHAFSVDSPVFGLVWGEGSVRAHVDWASEDNGEL
ncbi:hypothetical protein EXIGLDRAFT_830850, partial [Exidia glandulosa HHB12029]